VAPRHVPPRPDGAGRVGRLAVEGHRLLLVTFGLLGGHELHVGALRDGTRAVDQ
jgi:hypothetical protein